MISNYSTELQAAVVKSAAASLLRGSLQAGKAPLLAQRETTLVVDRLINDSWPLHVETGVRMPAPGMCLVLAARILPLIKQQFACDAWVTFGWLYDTTRQKALWRNEGLDAVAHIQQALQLPPMERLVASAKLQGMYHAWVTLDTGEAIDPSVFPTCAAAAPQRFAKGKREYSLLDANGQPYRKHTGLPKFQFHPEMLLDEYTASEFVQFDDRQYPDNTPLPK